MSASFSYPAQILAHLSTLGPASAPFAFWDSSGLTPPAHSAFGLRVSPTATEAFALRSQWLAAAAQQLEQHPELSAVVCHPDFSLLGEAPFLAHLPDRYLTEPALWGALARRHPAQLALLSRTITSRHLAFVPPFASIFWHAFSQGHAASFFQWVDKDPRFTSSLAQQLFIQLGERFSNPAEIKQTQALASAWLRYGLSPQDSTGSFAPLLNAARLGLSASWLSGLTGALQLPRAVCEQIVDYRVSEQTLSQALLDYLASQSNFSWEAYVQDRPLVPATLFFTTSESVFRRLLPLIPTRLWNRSSSASPPLLAQALAASPSRPLVNLEALLQSPFVKTDPACPVLAKFLSGPPNQAVLFCCLRYGVDQAQTGAAWSVIQSKLERHRATLRSRSPEGVALLDRYLLGHHVPPPQVLPQASSSPARFRL